MSTAENYSKTTGSLWKYFRDELTNCTSDNNNFNKNVINSKSFKYKTNIIGSTYDVDKTNAVYVAIKAVTKDVKIVIPLKHLIIFWRTLVMPLINCEASLTLTWPENCVITKLDKTVTAAQGNNPAVDKTNQESATFKITDTKLYVLVVILSTENDKKLLEQLRTRFKGLFKWNNYRSEMTNQAKIKNLNYLIDPTFTKVNRLFVLSFEN